MDQAFLNFLDLSGIGVSAKDMVNDSIAKSTSKEQILFNFKKMVLDWEPVNLTESECLELIGVKAPTKKLTTDSKELISVKNPSELPDPSSYSSIWEPMAKMEIISPEVYTGKIIELINDCRGVCTNIGALSAGQIQISCELPLGEMIIDFYDSLKSLSRGFASMSYDLIGFQPADLVMINILINSKEVAPLSFITHRSRAENIGRQACEKLKELIPRQQIEVAIQAAIGARVIARETIKPFRKDVTAKLYGGDISRRMKLLDKQKEGKKKMRTFGNVNIPKEVFLNMLKKG